VRLFCFPYAGGGAAVYRSWPRSLPSWVDFCAVQPPGRGWRFKETPFTRVADLVDALADAVEPLLDLPHLLFGHSLGAVVAFEFAREVRRRHGRSPLRIVVAAHRAPHIADPRPPIHSTSDEDFLRLVQERYRGGIPAEVVREPEILRLLLPALRADLEMDWTYRFAPDRPLDCPITAVGGEQDSTVAFAQITAWNRHTTGVFRAESVPGDHFFLDDAEAPLARFLLQGLQGLARSSSWSADATQAHELRRP
jgi:medium-chain acyl-[acyl-carrier-protein] hydrolase